MTDTIKDLIGKKIVSAKLKKIDEKYDDIPILELIMEGGTVFEIIADYSHYTGESEDEYPRFIEVKRK